jgi:hypothetical protein
MPAPRMCCWLDCEATYEGDQPADWRPYCGTDGWRGCPTTAARASASIPASVSRPTEVSQACEPSKGRSILKRSVVKSTCELSAAFSWRISGIAIFRIPPAIPPWRRSGSRSFFEIDMRSRLDTDLAPADDRLPPTIARCPSWISLFGYGA